MKPHLRRTVKTDNRGGEEYHRRSERKQWEIQNRIAQCNNRITGIGVVFSLGAAIVAIVAAAYAAAAYRQTILDVRAANNQATQARRQADAATQPYIFVSETDNGSADAWIFGSGAFINVKIVGQNYGAAPAIVNYAGCILIWGTAKAPPPDAMQTAGSGHPIQLDNFAKFPIVVGPNATISGQCAPAWPLNDKSPPDTRQALLYRGGRAMNGDSVWVVGLFDYTDVNGGAHHTAFCAFTDTSGTVTPGGDSQCQERD